MEKARAKTVESIFHEALARPPAERERYLAEACQGDSDLHREVASLLKAYDSPGGLLDSDALAFLQQAPELPPVLREGDRIASYRIVRFLDKGGMSEVYEAYDERLQRRVAVKTLPKSFADNPARVERLQREARTVSALNHPNILTIYDFGRQANIEFIVSELVEGVSLRQLIGKLTRSEAIGHARQIGEALKAAHAAGVIHRDIKPENVMVRPDGYVKVLDFGLAKVQAPVPARTATAHQLSEPGLIMGTLNYMSPEQWNGEQLDQRTDIWSWGVVLYEMLSGQNPFNSPFFMGARTPPCDDRGLNAIIDKALSEAVNARFQTMAEALEELDRIPRPAPLPPPPPVWITLARNWRTWALLAVLIAALPAINALHRWYLRCLPPRITITRPLVNSGNVRLGAISPDGSYVAFVTSDNEGQTLRLMQPGLGYVSVRIAASPREYRGLAFSKDGRFIYYVLAENSKAYLYRVPLIAGDPRLVEDDVDSPPSFSPDGSQFVFKRNRMAKNGKEPGTSSLFTRPVDGGPAITLAKLTLNDAFYSGPLWSPDGNSILCGTFSARQARPGSGVTALSSIGVRDHVMHEVKTLPWNWMSKPVWTNGGYGVLVAASALDANHRPLMWVPVSKWVPWFRRNVVPLSTDMSDYLDLDATADMSQIIAVSSVYTSTLQVAPWSNPDQRQKIAEGKYYFASWAGPGDLITQTDIGGRPVLWRIETESGKNHGITDSSSTEPQHTEQQPVVTPDQKYLVYVSNLDGNFHLWRSRLDGSNPVRLTSGSSWDYQPAVTPDSKWIVYTSTRSGFWALWKISVDGGEPQSVSPDLPVAQNPEVSPDSHFIACNRWFSSSGWQVVILNADDGRIVSPPFPRVPGDAHVHWSPDGKSLFYIDAVNGSSQLFSQPKDGGFPNQLTHSSGEKIFAVTLSPDRQRLAFVQGREISNLVLLSVAH